MYPSSWSLQNLLIKDNDSLHPPVRIDTESKNINFASSDCLLLFRYTKKCCDLLLKY